jgi:hypothetical protein
MNSPEISSELVPHNFEINREVFNCEILPFTNVMVCQGSMGSTLESLYHGVPVVAMPSQPYNSEVSYRLAGQGWDYTFRHEILPLAFEKPSIPYTPTKLLSG